MIAAFYSFVIRLKLNNSAVSRPRWKNQGDKMQIARYIASCLSVAVLGFGLYDVPARAKDNTNGNGNSQANEEAETIPPNAKGQLQRGVPDTKANKGSSQTQNVIDHHGPVLPSSKQYFIFWGPPGDFPRDAMTGLTSLAQGLAGSSYLGIMQQYMRGASISTMYVNVASDLSAPPSHGPSTASIVNEACKAINSNSGWSADSNALYTVVTSNFPHINYCAWHASGTCNGTTIQVAYLPNASGVAGCDPGNLFNCNGYSQGTRSMADSYAHEFSETITDPQGNAWYDQSGAEIGDKCNFNYSACVSLKTGSWQLQKEWSNAISACQQ